MPFVGILNALHSTTNIIWNKMGRLSSVYYLTDEQYMHTTICLYINNILLSYKNIQDALSTCQCEVWKVWGFKQGFDWPYRWFWQEHFEAILSDTIFNITWYISISIVTILLKPNSRNTYFLVFFFGGGAREEWHDMNGMDT